MENHDYTAVKTLAMIETKQSLQEAEISMPSSMQTLAISRDQGLDNSPDTSRAQNEQTVDESIVSIDTRALEQTCKHTEQARSEGENLLETDTQQE